MQDREQHEALKDKLIEAFRTARKIMCGSTLIIGSPAEVEVYAKKALRRGETVTENGISQWISNNVVFESDKPGSHAYVWDKTGNKVKHEKVLVTKDREGKITAKTIGFCFLEWNV
jgi:hypothetical protein